MKRVVIKINVCLMAMLFSSCAGNAIRLDVDRLAEELNISIDSLNNRVERLENSCKILNTNINTLQALVSAEKMKKPILSVNPIIGVGYEITMGSGEKILLHNGSDGRDGKDGYIPAVGVRKDDDGLYYWTVDGDWMTDVMGMKVPVTGVDGCEGTVPQLKIEEDLWMVSYDNGQNWISLGKSVGEPGHDGESMLRDVLVTDGGLHITLFDGTEVIIPIKREVEISFNYDFESAAALPGKEINIRYLLTNASESTFVTASADGIYKVIVEKESKDGGVIHITCPSFFSNGYVVVEVSDGSAYSFAKIIDFYEGRISFPSGLEFFLATEGGDLKVPFNLNFDYVVSVDDSSPWISLCAATKAGPSVREEFFTVNVARNREFRERRGKVYVYSRHNLTNPMATVNIIQAPAYFNLDYPRRYIAVGGGSYTFNILSSNGLRLNQEELPEWISAQVLGDGVNYKVEVTATPNPSGENRRTEIRCYDDRGESLLGTIILTQVHENAYDPETMVFLVRANNANDFSVQLPLYGTSYEIDWGDGSVSSHTGGLPTHIYSDKSNKDYEVTIRGSIYEINSHNVSAPCVVEVRQWGHTGLTSLNNAFYRNHLLRKVVTDNDGSFTDVTNFIAAFSYCPLLEEIPVGLFSGCEKAIYFNSVFYGNSALRSIPDNLFSCCVSAISFSCAFKYCEALTSIPEGLFSNCKRVSSFNGVFSDCKGLTDLPSGLFLDCPEVIDFSSAFRECEGLTELPSDLFLNCCEATNFSFVFAYCRMLQRIPTDLFSRNLKINDLIGVFCDCNNLKGESPYSMVNGEKVHLYEREFFPDYFIYPRYDGTSFSRCWSLSDINEIPSSWGGNKHN